MKTLEMLANASGVSHEGQEIAEGRYRMVARLGDGSMGQVYRARDGRLNTDVVIKFPIASQTALDHPDLLRRFQQEIRSLVELSHPHIVRIVDVGTLDGLPYVVMQYLSGGSLKSRMESGPGGKVQPMAPAALKGWVPAMAKAVDFLHEQGHVHRDIKPANILFDRHGNAFLADFGLIKAMASNSESAAESRQTAAGFVLGTPNYLAPEVIMGEAFTPRADQYALAMTIHEALVGRNVMEGPTASATLVNQTKLKPPAPCEIVPGVPETVSRAVLKGLEKEPGDRYESCAELSKAVLIALAATTRPVGAVKASSSGSSELPGCPKCGAKLPLVAKHVGKSGRCSRCGSSGVVEMNSRGEIRLRLSSGDSGSGERAVTSDRAESLALVDEQPRGTALLPKPMATSVVRQLPPKPPAARAEKLAPAGDDKQSLKKRRKKKNTGNNSARITQLLGALSAISMAAMLYFFFFGGKPKQTFVGPAKNTRAVQTTDSDFTVPGTGAAATGAGAIAVAASVPGQNQPYTLAPDVVAPAGAASRVKLNIAYGTEKHEWLQSAVEAFGHTETGRDVEVTLLGMGSIEGASAILGGSVQTPIHVWSPASSAYRAVFEKEWSLRYEGKSPILRAENLAFTPMVFVMWKERFEPFARKYGKVTIRTIAQAMAEPGGWGTIAARPEWGEFKFTHTDPEKSNSGMLALVLAAHEFKGQYQGLRVEDVTNADFQDWLSRFEGSLTRPGGAGPLSPSTGTQMKEMVLRGPSQVDCLLVYENLAIDYLKDAEQRWGEIRVVYPDPGIWNENPYYVLDVPWSDEKTRAAASAFLAFLMSEPMQQKALEYGFRPGNTGVGVRVPGSPLLENERYGVTVELPRMCEPPGSDVLSSLLTSFRRQQR